MIVCFDMVKYELKKIFSRVVIIFLFIGKPIASTVTKIAPEVVLSEERVTGNVTTELKTDGSGGDTQGRISYENRGECFFLPYTKDDVEGNVTLRAGDKVSFQIATNNR